MAREDLRWALDRIGEKKRRDAYKLTRDYYEGKHRLVFADERFLTIFGTRFSAIRDNLCPAVVDAVADRLKVTGFATSAATQENVTDGGTTRTRNDDPLAEHAWQIWKRNRMPVRAREVHRESLITGDGYAIVWPDKAGRAAIWPHAADEMVVRYSEQVPGELDFAVRIWSSQDGTQRANVFYPDHVERYKSRQARSWIEKGAAAVGLYDTLPQLGDVPNPYGRVPVFHFPNRRLWQPGVSELDDVIPLQDALNKAVCDLIVSMEFSAFRQRWATGIELEIDDDGKVKAPPFVPGIDKVYASEDPNSRFGDFAETDLEQFLKVQEDLRAEIARVSGTPLHYLFITRGDFPSGEAMKSAEARFTSKLEDQQDTKGDGWENAIAFALRIEDENVPDDLDIDAIWDEASPRSESERLDGASKKRALGVSETQVLRELGYSDKRIEEMQAERAGAADPAGEELGLMAQRLGLAAKYGIITNEQAQQRLREAGFPL